MIVHDAPCHVTLVVQVPAISAFNAGSYLENVFEAGRYHVHIMQDADTVQDNQ